MSEGAYQHVIPYELCIRYELGASCTPIPGRRARRIIETVAPLILAVANQKGGVGKTTTVINVATLLAERGRRILVVDCDPQANATSGLGVARRDIGASTYDVLVLGRPLSEARIPTAVDGLDLVPADIALAGAEIELVGVARREKQLTYALEALAEDPVDYVFLDCPPSLGLLTVNAVVAAHGLVVPIQCEFYALEGLGLLTHTINLLRRELNPGLQVTAIVLTLHNSRLTLANQVVDEVRKRFGTQVLEPVIPRNVRLSEAPSYGLPISLYAPNSRGAQAYRELASNLDERLQTEIAGLAARSFA